MHKVAYSPLLGQGKFIKPAGEEYQGLKGKGNIMAVGKNITCINGKGEALSSSL